MLQVTPSLTRLHVSCYMIVVVDFGSQTAHLIARRVKDLGVTALIVQPDIALSKIVEVKPQGIILSGGPASVYEPGAPSVDKRMFELSIPVLGICYGQQLMAHLLPGGQTAKGKIREDGPATLILDKSSLLLAGVSPHSRIWMSHGDAVISPPDGFTFVAHSLTTPSAAMVNEKKRLYGVQFHPEVEHTEHGNLILTNFLQKICHLSIAKQKINLETIIDQIKEKIGDKKAIAAVSGGLDSTVASVLTAKAIGKNLIPIHIDNGLMRAGTTKRVIDFFSNKLGIKPIILKTQDRFLASLTGKTDPEEKRKVIGKLYIDLFQEEVKKYPEVRFLVQGTIYSDVIESKGSRHAANIKSHHNVGGLPETLQLKLIEPIREFYTDQVRQIAHELQIPTEFINQQPHPGPGYAIRILGEVTAERLTAIQMADEIVVSELKAAGLYEEALHSFPIFTNAKSTSVKGDGRVFGEVVAIRALTSKDRMTADWARLPYDLMQKLSSRITNEIPLVSRVVYDITTKPPATMEWE